MTTTARIPAPLCRGAATRRLTAASWQDVCFPFDAVAITIQAVQMKRWMFIFLGSWVIKSTWSVTSFADQVAVSSMGNGSVSVTVQGAAGMGYSVQGTANLSYSPGGLHWFNLGMTNADTNGVFNFIDQSATNYPARFYRSVRLTPMAGFGRGLTAKGRITLSGGAYLDSYNSSIGPYSISNRGDFAVAFTDSSATNAISLGNGCTIAGHAMVGPSGGLMLSTNCSIGQLNWVATEVGIQPGYFANDSAVWIQDAPTPPSSVAWLPIPAPTNGVTILSGDGPGTTNYFLTSSLTSSGSSDPIIITNGGEVDLYCTGNLTTGGSGYIVIATNTTLVAYVNGTTTISGGGMVNSNGYATNCILYGLSHCASLTYSASAQFIGIVDAPQAALTLSGTAGVYGVLVANTITVTGGGAVHYDEALGGN